MGKSRETLERAIKVVEANEKWQAKVVYGDTDSLFVLLPGRSKDEAFQIGEEIAATVTKDNPAPVKLKMEKVYHPCILQVYLYPHSIYQFNICIKMISFSDQKTLRWFHVRNSRSEGSRIRGQRYRDGEKRWLSSCSENS